LEDASEPRSGPVSAALRTVFGVVLSHLSIHHFRNLGLQELAFPPEGVAIVGDNAQGKSNLLEAIYYLETFRSFRGARDDQLVCFDQPHFRVAGRVEDGRPGWGGVEVAAAFQKQGRRKRVTVDGAEPERLGDGLGRVGAILFSPADVALVSDGPAERRRFMDILLSLNAPGYLGALQRFRQILAQRNAALREGSPAELIRVWDGPLARAGATVTECRARWVSGRTDAFSRYYGAVSGRGGATLGYRSNLGGGGEDLRDRYEAALREHLDRDRRMGVTTTGPHRDDLVIRLEGEGKGLDVRDYGSGGQRRTATLALRLVEADTVREARGAEPIILLDDVFAELDEGRSVRILEFLDRPGAGQVILTAPRERDVRLRRESLPRWRIAGGAISR
jgi:DNA replication and repair protein RecF